MSGWNPRGRFHFEMHRVGGAREPVLVSYRGQAISKKANLIIHLHGGPESRECGEERFDGAFNRRVESGDLYLGWNYPGSIGFGGDWQRRPWKDWESCLLGEWEKLERWISRTYSIPKKRWVLVGPSFGAMVALVIARKESALRKIVLASPLLSLEAQMERVQEFDPSQLAWFRRRFSARDRSTLEFSGRLSSIRCPISIVFSGRDEILGAGQVREAIALGRSEGKRIRAFEQKHSFHAPASIGARRARSRFIEAEIEA